MKIGASVMNLGDGLVFEFEDGKPKLLLTTYSVASRNIKKVHPVSRPIKTALKSLQGSTESAADKRIRVQLKREEKKFLTETLTGKQETSRSKAPSRTGFKEQIDKVPLKPRVQNRGHKKPSQDAILEHSTAPPGSLKESLVCLTEDQLQKILTTITHASKNDPQNPDTSDKAQSDSTHAESLRDNKDTSTSCSNPNSTESKSRDLPKPKDDMWMLNGKPCGLFSTFGEREQEREALEAKKEQWKKELDEQVIFKQQQKKLEKSYNPTMRHNTGTSVKASTVQVNLRQGEQMDTRAPDLGEGSVQPKAQACISQQNLPAAIRSAFVVGEATPVEHAFSAKKREEQKKWLKELDQQKEDAKLRKLQEKQALNQREDHERWAIHFDSFQKRTFPQPPPVNPDGESGTVSAQSHTHQRSPSATLGLAWEGMSTEGDSLGRVSVDTTKEVQRASHLRTMTALLDPAQIEERERKRIKQLEHQRAIAAQVEERRRQREREEAQRRAEEQEEEQRLARERVHLQQQYELDKQRQKQKEELQTQRTKDLYLSVQRAQEEALKDKRQQKTQNGHNVSRLSHCMEGEAVPSLPHKVDKEVHLPRSLTGTAPLDTMFLRREAAVQTDVDMESLRLLGLVNLTMDDKISEYNQQALWTKHPKPGKENVDAGTTNDPYQAFARTTRQHARKKPEWNIQKPIKPFVPASERYPAGLQQQRQESRLRRQRELITLMERNTTARLPHSEQSNLLRRHSQSQEDNLQMAQESNPQSSRTQSPPVPAAKNKLQHHLQHRRSSQETSERPSSSDYIPYVRTDEVYHLDPMAPLSRPSSQDALLQTHLGAEHGKPTSFNSQRNPLLNPVLLKNKERQQAILKGLTDLRQGLLHRKQLKTGHHEEVLSEALKQNVS